MVQLIPQEELAQAFSGWNGNQGLVPHNYAHLKLGFAFSKAENIHYAARLYLRETPGRDTVAIRLCLFNTPLSTPLERPRGTPRAAELYPGKVRKSLSAMERSLLHMLLDAFEEDNRHALNTASLVLAYEDSIERNDGLRTINALLIMEQCTKYYRRKYDA